MFVTHCRSEYQKDEFGLYTLPRMEMLMTKISNKNKFYVALFSAISVAVIFGMAHTNTAAAAAGGTTGAPWITDLNNLQTMLQNQIATLSGNLATISGNQATLTTNLDNEISSRKAGESALSSQITDLGNLIANPPPPPSKVDAFLEIDGIPGESTDAKHPNTIEIDSWSFGETQTGISASGGGGGAGKVSFQDIHFVTKTVDKSSPKLFLAGASGDHIKTATLFVRKAGGSFDYLQIKLTDVLVSSYQTGGSSSSDIPTESFSLNFAKIEYQYTGTDNSGNSLPPMTGGWDISANKLL